MLQDTIVQQFQWLALTHPNLSSLWLSCLRKQDPLQPSYRNQAKKVLRQFQVLPDLQVGQIALLIMFSQSLTNATTTEATLTEATTTEATTTTETVEL